GAPEDCASRDEATSVFVGGTDWFLSSSLDRRAVLKGAGSAALGLLASACGSSRPSTAPVRSAAAAGAAESRETVYVFNVGSKDVTLIDVANRQVRETRPLGASVRWLSNEQTYWDGARIWTYDFPNDQVQAIAIDPRQVAITKTMSRAITSSRSSTSSTAAWTPRSSAEHSSKPSLSLPAASRTCCVSPDGKEVWV